MDGSSDAGENGDESGDEIGDGSGEGSDDSEAEESGTDGNSECGNGMLDGAEEECDDGNRDNSDACTTECLSAACGDEYVQAPEECDDGNVADGDSCQADCTLGSFDPELAVVLGTAGDFVMLAKTGISTVPTSSVTGDIGISPAAATAITGFSLIADPTNVFSSSTQVIGQVYAADYTVPTPATLTAAVAAMELAYTDAAGRAPDVTELGAGNIGGMVLPAGVYKWASAVLIPTDVTLVGSATDVWIFQIADGLTMSSGAAIHLTGGALAKNVFWQLAGGADLGTSAHFEGVVLSQTLIRLGTNASINGRLLAQTAVDIEISTVVEPAD